MEINVDVEELQMFDGIASCANHIVNFRIVENQLDLLLSNKPFFHPKYTH